MIPIVSYLRELVFSLLVPPWEQISTYLESVEEVFADDDDVLAAVGESLARRDRLDHWRLSRCVG